MEVISGASAIVQLLDVLCGLGLGVQNYIQTIKNAPETICTIKSYLQHVASLLPKLKEALGPSNATGVLSFVDAQGQLNDIILKLIELNCQLSQLLEEYKDVGTSGSVKARWALSGKERAEEFGKRLGALNSALQIVLQFSQMKFQVDQADRADEQMRIMMTMIEKERPRKKNGTAYTESWVSSNVGVYAESAVRAVWHWMRAVRGEFPELESIITRHKISNREVLDLRTEDELLSMYTASTVDDMTAAVAAGDVARSAFCASLAKELYVEVWDVRGELEDLLVSKDGRKDDDASTVVEGAPVEPVPSLDFPFMVRTYEDEVKKERKAREREERRKAREGWFARAGTHLHLWPKLQLAGAQATPKDSKGSTLSKTSN